MGQKKWLKLGASIVIDGVGVSTYVLPGAGEVGDAGWAPVSAVLVQSLYGRSVLSGIDFMEEILPFTDAVPTATIGWCLEYTPLGQARWLRWLGKGSGPKRGGGEGEQ
jgi:hypothetical protein